MAKKYYPLEYLESFIGKEFINSNGGFHLKIIGLSNYKYARNTFSTQLSTFCVYTRIPLRNETNGSINVDNLSVYYVPKTKASNILYRKP